MAERTELMSLDDLAVGDSCQLHNCGWLAGVPSALHDYNVVSDGFVIRTQQGILEWTVKLKFVFSIGWARRSFKGRGLECIKLAQTIRKCREQNITISELIRTTHSSNRIKWEWKADHQTVVGEIARMIRPGEELGTLRWKDLIYIIGPTGEAQSELLDIWIVRKIGESGPVVTSLVEPNKFKMVEVKWEDLKELLPIVAVSGIPARGLEMASGRTLAQDGSVTLCDLKGRTEHNQLRPPILCGMRLT